MCAQRSDRDPAPTELHDAIETDPADGAVGASSASRTTGSRVDGPPPRVVVDEPERDGTVVHIAGRFRSSGSLYHWAAVRVEGLWHVAGKDHPEPMPWDDLVAWVEGSLSYADVTVMETGAGR